MIPCDTCRITPSNKNKPNVSVLFNKNPDLGRWSSVHGYTFTTLLASQFTLTCLEKAHKLCEKELRKTSYGVKKKERHTALKQHQGG